MVNTIQKVSLGIADSNVNASQFFPSQVGRNHLGNVIINYLIKNFIARIAICLNFGFRAQTLIYDLVEVVDLRSGITLILRNLHREFCR